MEIYVLEKKFGPLIIRNSKIRKTKQFRKLKLKGPKRLTYFQINFFERQLFELQNNKRKYVFIQRKSEEKVFKKLVSKN